MAKVNPLGTLIKAITNVGGSPEDIKFLNKEIANKIARQLAFIGLITRCKNEAYFYRPVRVRETPISEGVSDLAFRKLPVRVVEFVEVSARDTTAILKELKNKGYRPISRLELDEVGEQNSEEIDSYRDKRGTVLALDNKNPHKILPLNWYNKGQAYPYPWLYFSCSESDFDRYIEKNPHNSPGNPLKFAAILKKKK